METGRPETFGFGEALKFVLHKRVLGFDLLDGPQDREAEAISIINFARWGVDETSHAHIWLVTVGHNRADLVVEVPDSLALDALADDIGISDQRQLLHHVHGVMHLVSLFHVSDACVHTIDYLQARHDALAFALLAEVLLELITTREVLNSVEMSQNVMDGDQGLRKSDILAAFKTL